MPRECKSSKPEKGGVLAGIVWKFFERVEAVLNEDTKLEIARWLRVKNIESGIIADEAVNWPTTFAKVFDRVFGTKHLSWKCFWRPAIASYCAVAISFSVLAVRFEYPGWKRAVWLILICGSVGNVVPDYISLLETRLVLRAMSSTTSSAALVGLLLVDATVTAVIGEIGGVIADID